MEHIFFSTTFIILISIYLIFLLAGKWATFEKAGEKGWKSLIPIYNTVIILKMVGKPWWWVLLYIIPPVGIVIHVMVSHLLSQSFGQGIIYTIGLYFFSPVFYLLIGFKKSIEYVGPEGIV